jgi:hypothetical protein
MRTKDKKIACHFIILINSCTWHLCGPLHTAVSCIKACTAESIQLFLEDQAFWRSFGSTPRPPPPPPHSCQQVVSLSQSSCGRRSSLLIGEWRCGWARSQVIRPWESLALHNSFNILWCKVLYTVCMSNIPLHSYILWCPFVNGDNLTLKMRTLHFENIKIWKEICLLLFFSCSLLSCFLWGEAWMQNCKSCAKYNFLSQQ